MSYNWGPNYIVPTPVLKNYSGIVTLREGLDKELLHKELESLNLSGTVTKITNPWYCRKKGAETWIKIGESTDEHQNFATLWNTTELENGQYEVMGLMHVFVKKGNVETAIARQNIVEISIQN
jgi:hypothetical protein